MRRHDDDCLSPIGTPRGVAARLASVDPEPIIGQLEEMVTERRRARLQEVARRRIASVTVALDAPHDPHNGAAVLRSCDAFGIHELHVLERSEPFLVARKVAKGAQRWVAVHAHDSAESVAATMERSGHRIVGTHPEGELVPTDLAEIPRLALLLGNEHGGMGDDVRSICSACVRVPMRGFVESLNLSVTAAILLCFATMSRRGDLPLVDQRRLYAAGLLHSVPRAKDVLRARGVAW